MVGWRHRLNGHEFEQAPRDGDGPGRCAAVHGVAESDMIELLNNKLLFAPRDNTPMPRHVRKTCLDLAHAPLQPRACLTPLGVTRFSPAGVYLGPSAPRPVQS